MPAFWDSTTKSIVVTFDPSHETVDVTSVFATVVPNMMVKKVDTSADPGYPIIPHHWHSDQISTDPAPWPIQNPPAPLMRYMLAPKFTDKNGIDRPYPNPDASLPPTQIGPDTVQYHFDFTALAARGGDNGQTSITIQIQDVGGGGGNSGNGTIFVPDWLREIIHEKVEVMLLRNNFIPKPPVGPDSVIKKKIKSKKIEQRRRK
jgi:hypothetical protein